MEFGSLDGREDGEHIGVCFVEIAIFAMQGAFYLEQNHVGNSSFSGFGSFHLSPPWHLNFDIMLTSHNAKLTSVNRVSHSLRSYIPIYIYIAYVVLMSSVNTHLVLSNSVI